MILHWVEGPVKSDQAPVCHADARLIDGTLTVTTAFTLFAE